MTSPPLPAPPPDNRWRRRITVALLVLSVAATAAWQRRVTRPDYRLARGTDAARARDWDAAEQFAARLEAAGHADHANVLRGEMLLARNQPAEALAALNRSKADGPLRVRAAVASGKCLLALRQLWAAYQEFAFVLDQNPDDIDGHRGLAAVAYDMGQLSQAGTHLYRVAELDPADARPHRLIGLIHKDLAQWPEAAGAYREALRRGLPDGVRREVRAELAAVLIEQAEYAAALAELDAEPAADNAEWLAARGESLRGLGRRAEAADLVERAAARFPTARLLRLKGQLLLDDSRSAAAAVPLEAAVKAARTDHEARYLLAQAYAGAGRKDDAAREFKAVDELRADFARLTELSRDAMAKPWDADVRRNLAELCDRLEKPDLAAMWRTAAAAAGQGR